MSDRDAIHEYLKSLSKYLSRLKKADADEVIREIESHIHDALEANREETHAANILEGFGSPRDLAAEYVTHILDGKPPPAGFKAIQKVKKGVTKGLYYSTGFVGYLFSITLLSLGLCKIVVPEIVGIWPGDPNFNTVVIGAMADIPEGTNEMLGWWFVPVAIGLGFGAAYLTKRILSILKDKL